MMAWRMLSCSRAQELNDQLQFQKSACRQIIESFGIIFCFHDERTAFLVPAMSCHLSKLVLRVHRFAPIKVQRPADRGFQDRVEE